MYAHARKIAALLCAVYCLMAMPMRSASGQALDAPPPYTGPASDALDSLTLPVGQSMPEVHAALSAWCLRVDEALRKGVVPQITATLHEEEAAWQVLQLWAKAGDQRICLATMRFDPACGELRLPEDTVLQALSDPVYVRATLALGMNGIALDPAWYLQPATTHLLLEWLTQAYSSLAENPAAAREPATNEAALLFSLEPQANDTVYKKLTRETLAVYALRWAAFAERIHFRTAAQPAKTGHAQNTLQLAVDLLGLHEDVPTWWPADDPTPSNGAMTRLRYAQAAMALMDAAQQPRSGQQWMPELYDTGDHSARRACGLGLMTYVRLEPESLLCFDPYRVMSRDSVWAHALRFAQVYAADDTSTSNQMLTIGEAAPLVHRLLRAFDGVEGFTGSIRTVDNGGDTAWYFDQESSGSFAATNCMPAAAAMALRWVDPDCEATPGSLRALYPMDGAPWYPQQVAEVFDTYGVAYELPDIDQQHMLQALDAGHILLVLINEDRSGHCVIIKGYVQEGEGVWFVTYDPSSPTVNANEEPVGKDRHIEATELLFAMECHWWRYFDISQHP